MADNMFQKLRVTFTVAAMLGGGLLMAAPAEAQDRGDRYRGRSAGDSSFSDRGDRGRSDASRNRSRSSDRASRGSSSRSRDNWRGRSSDRTSRSDAVDRRISDRVRNRSDRSSNRFTTRSRDRGFDNRRSDRRDFDRRSFDRRDFDRRTNSRRFTYGNRFSNRFDSRFHSRFGSRFNSRFDSRFGRFHSSRRPVVSFNTFNYRPYRPVVRTVFAPVYKPVVDYHHVQPRVRTTVRFDAGGRRFFDSYDRPFHSRDRFKRDRDVDVSINFGTGSFYRRGHVSTYRSYRPISHHRARPLQFDCFRPVHYGRRGVRTGLNLNFKFDF